MTTNNLPAMGKKELIKSTLIAVIIGGIVLVTAVLPAEYNIDPLGTGELLGFNKLYVNDAREAVEVSVKESPVKNLIFKPLHIKKLGSSPAVPKPIEANNPPPTKQSTSKTDSIDVLIPAGKGVEFKFKALKHASIKYDWSTSHKDIVFIDFHGEVKTEKKSKSVFFESYTLAYANNMAGTFTAPFEGKHGWYFKNENAADVMIKIHLKGEYELFEK